VPGGPSEDDGAHAARAVARMTELAVARAVARLDGPVVGEREQVMAPRLVVRGTTAPPPPGPRGLRRRST
jgi:hypothetical protein